MKPSLLLLALFATLIWSPLWAVTPAQEAMLKCHDNAGNREGEERKKFMTECLTAEVKSWPKEVQQSAGWKCDSNTGNGCEVISGKKYESKLSKAFLDLRAELKTRGESELEGSLVDAQNIWVKYREAHCLFDASVEGANTTSWSPLYGECKESETERRTRYLQDILTKIVGRGW